MTDLRVPILMYHKVGSCPPGAKVPFHYVSEKRFKSQMTALARRGFKTISVASLTQIFSGAEPPPSKPIVVTFDDGYQNFLTAAVPMLKACGQTATVFVVTGQIGGTNAWDTALGDVEERLLTDEQLRQIDQSGFEIGSHTVNHCRLAIADPETVRQELEQSREQLGTLLGRETKVFCYPYGSYTQDVRQAVQDAGYQAACSVEKGWNSSKTDRYLLKRVNVRKDTSSPILFWKLWQQNRTTVID